ncbi:MAG: 50S ribosomal protein L35 [Magnetococcales bacterium]|nr:50S ribosomal protein L35 [Magnetococcales bacterium]
MPKIKTHKGAAKRFSATGSGKLKRNKANHRHILTKKSMNRKRNLRDAGLVSAADEGLIRQMLPNL